MIFTTLGLAGAAATLPGTVELSALTFASLFPQQAERGDPAACGKLAVVVPAHDEEGQIARCVESLRACEQPPNGARIIVVADNCQDRTAERARAAGAEVIERFDDVKRGKGFALEMAFGEVLADESIEAVIVVDADTTVDHAFLVTNAAAFASGADGTQCRYLVGNAGASQRTRLMNVALLAFNVARPRGRERMGVSVGILGNGFALHRRVLEQIPYTAHSVVEDLEYHLMMVEQGYRVRFLEETSVTADVPTSEEGTRTQRARWEGGRFRMIREHAPSLARRVLGGELRSLEPLGELLLLPLATHVGLLTVTLLVPFPPTQIYAASSLALVGAHVLTSLGVAGGGKEELRALASAPFYVLKKAMMLPSLLRAAKKDQAWVRTQREGATAE
jgi:cellulose synthase/poly-beta-1,6-N-acetylglucosamine synthase-like glycosyltransferase